MVARKELQRKQRRAAARRAFVLEPAAKQFELLTEAELADRAVCDRALAIVRTPGAALDLVLPLGSQVGQLALGAALRQRGRLSSG